MKKRTCTFYTTPTIQCACWFCHSYLSETKKVNIQFLNVFKRCRHNGKYKQDSGISSNPICGTGTRCGSDHVVSLTHICLDQLMHNHVIVPFE